MKSNQFYCVGFLIVLFFVGCTEQATVNNDSSSWRGINRDGIFDEHGLLTEWPEEGPPLMWKYSELGLGFSSPAIVGNSIFINGAIDSIGYLFKLDLNGNLVWKKSYGLEWMNAFPGVRTSPIVIDEYVYVLSGIGGLYCLKTENGEMIWEIDLFEKYGAQTTTYGISENLIIHEDILYCTPGGIEHNVIALNRFTGELIWSCAANGEKSAYCNPLLTTINGEKYFITMTDKSVISINTNSGEMVWSHPLEGIKNGAHVATPYYRDGYLFLMDGFEIGAIMLKIAEDGQGAEMVWKNDLLDETNGHSVVIDNNIYGSAESKNKLVCLDWKTGELKFELKKFAPGTVIFADNHLYTYTYAGLLGLVKPTETEFIEKGSLKLAKSRELHIMHPIIHNGILYIRYVNELMAYNIKSN